MKISHLIIGLLVAGGIGYIFEPQVRYSLTGKTPDVKIEKPTIAGKKEQQKGVQIDLSDWSADQLPKTVVLTGDVELANEYGDFRAVVKAGTRVNLDGIDGQNARISSNDGGLKGSVSVTQTDLAAQLIELKKNGNIPAPKAGETETDPFGKPDVAEESGVEVASTVPKEPEMADAGGGEVTSGPFEDKPVFPLGDSGGEQAEVAAADPKPPEPVAPVPTTPEPTAPQTSSSNADVVAVMQASIKNRDIEEFGADQVTEWSPEAKVETIDGEVYGIGMLSYKAETVFGEKIIEAKALIQDGKVVRWLWPKSGMEIK
jgi:hypothetical protein